MKNILSYEEGGYIYIYSLLVPRVGPLMGFPMGPLKGSYRLMRDPTSNSFVHPPSKTAVVSCMLAARSMFSIVVNVSFIKSLLIDS